MTRWYATDLEKVFTPQMSIPEILVRGTIGYLGVLLLLRIFPRRDVGGVSLSDLLVISIVAGIVRNPLVGSSESIVDGLAIIVLVLLWSFGLDWLSFRVNWINTILHSKSIVIVKRGRVLNDNLSRELMTEELLKPQLREHGIDRLTDVVDARIESGGKVSVIKSDQNTPSNRRRRKK